MRRIARGIGWAVLFTFGLIFWVLTLWHTILIVEEPVSVE